MAVDPRMWHRFQTHCLRLFKRSVSLKRFYQKISYERLSMGHLKLRHHSQNDVPKLRSIPQNLVPDFKDEYVKEIETVKTSEDLYAVVSQNVSNYGPHHLFHVLKVLRDLHPGCNHWFKTHLTEVLCLDYKTRLCEGVRTVVVRNGATVPDELLTYILESFKLLGYVEGVAALLDECVERIDSFSPKSLSQFASVLSSEHNNSYFPFFLRNVNYANLPWLVKSIDAIDRHLSRDDLNVDDFGHLVLAAKRVHYINTTLVDKFATHVRHHLSNGNMKDTELIMNCLDLLVLPSNLSHIELKQLINDLCVDIGDRAKSLACDELFKLRTILLRVSVDTISITAKIMERAIHLLNVEHSYRSRLKLLNCVRFTELNKLPASVFAFEKSPAENFCFYCDGPLLLSAFRTNKAHFPIIDDFWERAIMYFGHVEFELFICHLYLWFKYFSNGSYYYDRLETTLKPLMLEQLRGGLHMWPHKATVACTLLLSRCIRKGSLSEMIFESLKSIVPNMDSYSHNLLTKAIQVGLQRSKQRSFLLDHQINDIIRLLDKHALRKAYDARDLMELSRWTLPYNFYQKIQDDSNLEEMMDRHQALLGTLSSKSLILVCNTLSLSRYYHAILLDEMAKYIMNNDVSGWATACLLYACYQAGHFPNTAKDFFKYCIDNIDMYWDQLEPTKVIKSCLAVALFYQLPTHWVTKLFAPSFLAKLDNEFHGIRNTGLSMQRRHYVLALNRIVCLEYPELNIPWFHLNNDISVIHERNQQSSFHSDVQHNIEELLGGNEFYRANVMSPYSYRISFEFMLKNRMPMIVPETDEVLQETSSGVQKVAVNLLTPQVYCSNVRKLIGAQHLKSRHLQMLDYKVVNIPHFEWYSSSLGDEKAKLNYLRKKIFS